VALETEALFLRKAVRAGVLDVDKGTAALYIFAQLQKQGAQFTFGEFLVERGLLTNMALSALTAADSQVQPVSEVGDYQLLELIGEGENGVVYRALQKSLERMVAVKILNNTYASDPEALRRFQNEARATAKLNHPNVVQGIDVGTDKGLHYFAMELVDGGSARAVLRAAGGQLDETRALDIAQQAAEGLRAAHAAGLIHRDLKPDNILMTTDGQAKLADLGISQSLAPRAPGRAEAEFWASPPYVAPEIIRGHAENKAASDIYSLGATLFELLTGHPPFMADTPEDILRKHLNDPVPDVLAFRPDVSVHTAGLIKRMLAKDPAARMPSASAVSDAIQKILALRTQAATAAAQPAQHPGKVSGFHAARPAGAQSGFHAARPAGASPGFRPARPVGSSSGLHPARPAGAPSGFHPARPAGASSGFHPARPAAPAPRPASGPILPRPPAKPGLARHTQARPQNLRNKLNQKRKR
jgi:serine/threonine protein kinase